MARFVSVSENAWCATEGGWQRVAGRGWLAEGQGLGWDVSDHFGGRWWKVSFRFFARLLAKCLIFSLLGAGLAFAESGRCLPSRGGLGTMC